MNELGFENNLIIDRKVDAGQVDKIYQIAMINLIRVFQKNLSNFIFKFLLKI